MWAQPCLSLWQLCTVERFQSWRRQEGLPALRAPFLPTHLWAEARLQEQTLAPQEEREMLRSSGHSVDLPDSRPARVTGVPRGTRSFTAQHTDYSSGAHTKPLLRERKLAVEPLASPAGELGDDRSRLSLCRGGQQALRDHVGHKDASGSKLVPYRWGAKRDLELNDTPGSSAGQEPGPHTLEGGFPVPRAVCPHISP